VQDLTSRAAWFHISKQALDSTWPKVSRFQTLTSGPHLKPVAYIIRIGQIAYLSLDHKWLLIHLFSISQHKGTFSWVFMLYIMEPLTEA